MATKIISGQQICEMASKIAAKGLPAQTEIDLPLSSKLSLPGKVGAVSSTMGTFHVANLYLRAMATGTEGQVYQGKCLSISFPDLDKDGLKDLELKVTIQRLDPKANPALVSSQVYERTFLYRPVEKIYEPMSGSPNPYVEVLIQ